MLKFLISSVARHEIDHVQVTAAGTKPAEGETKHFKGPSGNSLVILHLTEAAIKELGLKEGDTPEVKKA